MLRVALEGGLVPAAVAAAPAVVAFGDGITIEASMSVDELSRLARLGISVVNDHAGQPETVGHWAAILPLTVSADTIEPGSEVLFEMPATLLPEFAAEMTRLGNDRQSYLPLPAGRVLLKVLNPPYYTLLRALDRLDADLTAFAQAAPRLWIATGFSHPLRHRVRVDADQLILLRPPRSWLAVAVAQFRDIYELLQFPIADTAIALEAVETPEALQVPLRLTAGNAADLPEMWLLKQDAFEIVDAFVRDADERTLSGLAFAVIDDGRQILVRRRSPGPAIELPGAVGFIRYRRLANLFVPAGMRLLPALSRDAIRRQLAPDDDRVVWLTPNEGGSFTPESIPDDAFRPLSDWVDEVIDRDREPLETWLRGTTFEFESFVTKSEAVFEPTPLRQVRPRRPKTVTAKAVPEPATVPEPRPRAASSRELTAYTPLAQAAPTSELKKELDALEQRFLEIDGPLEATERQALWPQLARLNGALGDHPEAAICWANGLWERDDLPAAQLSAWFHSESSGSNAEVSETELDKELTNATPSQGDLRRLAARLLYACARTPVPPALMKKLPAVRAFLDTHEAGLGVRATWLVWRNLTLLSGDALALARVRDRLLGRMYAKGLQRLHDVPNFVHFAGSRDTSRLRQVHEYLLQFGQEVHAWLDRSKGLASTIPYADLMFAYGFAKLGDERHRQELASGALNVLRATGDPVSLFLAAAYEFRIERAAAGSEAGPLPAAILARLQSMDMPQTSAVNRMRRQSPILEPVERSNPYQRFERRVKANLAVDLANLQPLADPRRLQSEIRRIMLNGGTPLTADERLTVLIEATPLTPRVGREFVEELLALALQAVSAATPGDYELVAEVIRAVVPVAAQYDKSDLIQTLLGQFVNYLRKLDEAAVVESINKALGGWLRSLRRCGLKEQLDTLLEELTTLLVKGRTIERLRTDYLRESHRNNWVELLRALMQIAEWSIYNGNAPRATAFLDEARTFLFDNAPKPGRERPIATRYVPLANAYIRAVGQGSHLETMAGHFSELLLRMDVVRNTQTTQGLYSLLHLSIVESLVLALVGEDFALGETARRWLDEDEYLVRRRIHADMKRDWVSQGA